MRREGHKTNPMECREQSLHKNKPFCLLLCSFLWYFFHISILVLNGLLKQMMNIMIKLLLFLMKTKRFYSVLVGEGEDGRWGDKGAIMFFRETTLLFKSIDTICFWNKKKYTNSPLETHLCFLNVPSWCLH